jgi:hypothetical protein
MHAYATEMLRNRDGAGSAPIRCCILLVTIFCTRVAEARMKRWSIACGETSTFSGGSVASAQKGAHWINLYTIFMLQRGFRIAWGRDAC